MIAILSTGFATATDLFAEDLPSSPYVQYRQVKEWLSQGRKVIFLDVRQIAEFDSGHLPEAVNIPHDEVLSIAGRLSRDHPIVAYCIHSTHRAPAAAKSLREVGFQNVYVLEGGIVAWRAGGLTILASDSTRAPEILPQPACVCSGGKKA